MSKSKLAIALLAAGLMGSGAAWANDTRSAASANSATAQANRDTTTQANRDASAPGSKTERAKESLHDAGITTKVKAELAKEPGVSATHIKVDTDNGVVNLSGTAHSQQEADRAVAIAKSTKGVTTVNNHIDVTK